MRKQSKPTSRNITAERLADLKMNAAGILAEARRALMNRQPFIGSIAMNLNIVPVRDNRCPTAATDGKSIFFDIDFLSTLSPDQQIFILAHEIWHNVMLHFVRAEGRDKMLFNIATDLEVNQLLIKDGLSCPPEALKPDKYHLPADLSAEQYYDLLVKQSKSNSKQNSNSNGGYGSSNSANGNDDQDSQPSNGSGNPDGKLVDQFDKHVYEGENVRKEIGQDVDDRYGKVGQDPDFDPNPTAESVERIREAAVSAAQTYERNFGTLPAHIAQLVNKLLEPEISWQDVLTQFVTRCYGDRREWNPPNRRHVWHDSYLQSRRSEKLKIAVGIDTSGSIGQYLGKFLGELNALVNTFGRYELHVIQCDATVNKYDMYTDDEPLDLENEKFECYGGGGTALQPIFDYIDDNQIEVDAAVIFTDGYTSDKFTEDKAPAFPVLWMLTNDGSRNNIEFGEVYQFKM